MLAISNTSLETFTEPFDTGVVDGAGDGLVSPPNVPSRARDLLIDTMQLVEPRVNPPVPNHILNTKLYSKVTENELIHVNPSVVHFAGFELGKTFVQKLELQNMSTDMQQMHVIPPQTKYFKIKYTKKLRLVPGFGLKCTVEFSPDQWRYYYDCIRVHCKNEENLVIPIHAYPVMNTSEFPKLVDFPAVPLGETRTKVFPLRCQAPVDFEFQFSLLQPNPAFKVEPMSGIVPASGEVDIRISFSPTAFCSASMKVQLDISQFLARPLVCIVTGRCQPGMKRDVMLAKEHASAMESLVSASKTLDPSMISPLDRSRNRKLRTPRVTSSGAVSEPRSQTIERDGIQIPVNLSNPHSVAVVLNQKPGKLKMKDIRISTNGFPDVCGTEFPKKVINRQMKEAMFDAAIRFDAYEEKQNQLRWQVKRGKAPISAESRAQLLSEREDVQRIYEFQQGHIDNEADDKRRIPKLSWKKTRRLTSWVIPPEATFDIFTNDLWSGRHAAISRFRQAAWKIIIQQRVKPRLLALWKFLEIKGSLVHLPKGVVCQRESGDPAEIPHLHINRISSLTFPVYTDPNVLSKSIGDGPGILTLKQTAVHLKEKVPYFALKVPQQYKLMGYQRFGVREASYFIPPTLVRPLRTGAEDELIIIDYASKERSTAEDTSQPQTSSESDVMVLSPPKAMLQPIKYPALHIFNPIPGLMTFQNHLPYSEADPDYHLCPLPRFCSTDSNNPHTSTQKQYLDRQEIMTGVMTWKNFPSPSMVSLYGTPTLTNVWVPRWKDPFNQELLPYSVPSLFESLAEDDQIAAESSESAENEVHLTLDMVRAQFTAFDVVCETEEDLQTSKEYKKDSGSGRGADAGKITSSGSSSEVAPLPRKVCESDLDAFLKSRGGQLRQRGQARVGYLDKINSKKHSIAE